MNGTHSSSECLAIARVKLSPSVDEPVFVGNGETNTVKEFGGGETSFQSVHNSDEKTASIFAKSLQGLVAAVLLEGKNICICCYGTSRSGKAETMLGAGSDNNGIVQLAASTLFKLMEGNGKDTLFTISMCQVFSDTVIDLLNPSEDGASLEIKADRRESFAVSKQAFIVCRSEEDVFAYLHQGLKVHLEMARQHQLSIQPQLIIDFRVESQPAGKRVEQITYGLARFAMIEPAGQGVTVDSGLGALTKIIRSLAAGNEPESIPYNDSVLTKLMRNALGGNCETAFIATIEPNNSKADTSNNLKLISTATKIKNHPISNRSMLMSEIHMLRKEIRNSRSKMQLSNPGKFLHDIDPRDLAAFQEKLGQLEKLKESTWESKQKQSIKWCQLRKENLRKLGLLHTLQENITIDEGLVKRHHGIRKKVVRSLLEIQESISTLSKEERRQKKLEALSEGKITEQLSASKEKCVKVVEEQLKEKKIYNQHAKQFKEVTAQVIEQEEKQRRTFMMAAETLQVHQADTEYNLLKINTDNADAEELKEIKDELSSLNEAKKELLETHKEADESVKEVILKLYNAQRKSHKRGFERDRLRESLVESKFRYEVYMQRMETHMLDVFRQYREHFEEQKREMEDRYRQLLKESIQDAVHLQKKNLELQGQLGFLKKNMPSNF